MKVKKRLLAAISSLLLAASACVPLSASADSALLSTDKEAYTEGEAIMITAAGTGNDWVGIYRKGENPGSAIQSIRWYYVAKDGNTSGKAKNIFESEYTVRQDLKNLPAGEYTIFYVKTTGIRCWRRRASSLTRRTRLLWRQPPPSMSGTTASPVRPTAS